MPVVERQHAGGGEASCRCVCTDESPGRAGGGGRAGRSPQGGKIRGMVGQKARAFPRGQTAPKLDQENLLNMVAGRWKNVYHNNDNYYSR